MRPRFRGLDTTRLRWNGTAASRLLDLQTALAGESYLTNLSLVTVASAVNYPRLSAAATGNAPVWSAQGSDTDIGLTITPKGTGGLTLSTGSFTLSSGALVLKTAHDGLLAGAGKSSATSANSAADKNFLSFYLTHTNATGDNRGLYLRTYFGGASGGDCARVYATVTAASTTVHGQHTSLSFGTSGSLSGEGIASRNTFQVPNKAVSEGTFAPLEAEFWFDGTSAAFAPTAHGLIRATIGGADATRQKQIKNLLLVDAANNTGAVGVDVAQMVVTGATAATIAAGLTTLLRVSINGATGYIPVFIGTPA